MITLRRAEERGRVKMDWLDSRHTFSFGEYYDPRHMGISNLRVINDDTVIPGGGFATHGHRDMEIVSYVLSGALEHRDSMGNGSVIRPGDVQRMSAGTGVTHSEFNASGEEPVNFLQIWLKPNKLGVAPDYAQHHFPRQHRRGRLTLVVSPDGRDGSLPSNQGARVYSALLEEGDSVTHVLDTGRRAYVHLASGTATVNGESLGPGDGAVLADESQVRIAGTASAELLLFDLP